MKKIARLLFLAGALSLFAVSNSNAQDIVVRTRLSPPTSTLRERPPAPSPRHVWVAEEWAPRGASYTWKGGYWALPPHPHAIWVPGHWRHIHRGWAWRPGHWR
jgi:hypothetical protein